jgi:uncharacterized protein YyaL (SSP411 family)
VFHGRFLPHSILLLIDSDQTRRDLAQLFPAAEAIREIENRPTAYVCENYACQLPTNQLSKFDELLQ